MNDARRALFRPLPALAVATLVLNDHVMKRVFHNALTGKVSDVAGMVFFPVFLWGALSYVVPRTRQSLHALLWLSLLTASVFSLVKVWAPANVLYGWGLGILQWPFRATARIVRGRLSWPSLAVAPTLLDATDLLASPFAFLCYAHFLLQHARLQKPASIVGAKK
jgi:hypothetical protein